MEKTMSKEMEFKLMDALKYVSSYAASKTKKVCVMLTITPEAALKIFFDLGDEYVPFNMKIRELVLKKYKEKVGHSLYDKTEINNFPEDLVMACDSDIVILMYIREVVIEYISRNCNNMNALNQVAFLLNSDVKKNVVEGIFELQFYKSKVPYMLKRAKALSSYFKSQLEITKADKLTDESFDKMEAVKELFALIDEFECVKLKLDDILSRLMDGGIYADTDELLENMDIIEYVASLGVFKMPAALRELDEYVRSINEKIKRYEMLRLQLKAHGLRFEELIKQRKTVETALKIMNV